MIPKVLHYIWLGGKELPSLEKKCLDSWSRTNPSWEIKRWDESNLNIDDPVFTKAYKKKEWAYCSDYARMKVIYENGGVYIDTDMELVRPLDDLLIHGCFLGRENSYAINAAIIGASINNEFIYDVFSALKQSLENDFVPIPRILTSVYKKKTYDDVFIFSEEYFYPYNPHENEIKNLFYCDVTDKTFGIHHWKYSWKPSFHDRVIRKVKRIFSRSEYFYNK